MTSSIIGNERNCHLSAKNTSANENGNSDSFVNFNMDASSKEKWYGDMMHEPFVYSTIIWPSDSQKTSSDPSAAAVVIKCSAKLAYVSLASSAGALLGCRVRLEPVDADENGNDCGRHTAYKVCGTVAGLRPVELDPLWQTHVIRREQPALEHAVCKAVERALGTHNLEKEKNATIDLVGYDTLDRATRALWRDRLGFLVSDSPSMVEVSAPRPGHLIDAILAGTPVPKYVIRRVTSIDAHVSAYDKSVSGVDRRHYLAALLRLPAARLDLCVAADGEIVCGLAVRRGGNIMALYAESAHAARAQLLHALRHMRPDEAVTLSCVEGGLVHKLTAQCRAADPSVHITQRAVRRFHTVHVPQCIEWHKVYAFNRGMHLV